MRVPPSSGSRPGLKRLPTSSAGRHPVDQLEISPRPLADDNAWFGTLANPAGTITPNAGMGENEDTGERA